MSERRTSMVWDGTYWEGDFHIRKARTRQFISILDGTERIRCEITPIQSLLPCFLDEIKPLFGMPKRGTRWMRFQKRRWLMVPMPSRGRFLKNCTRVPLQDLQKIVCFRYLFGLSKIRGDNVLVCKGRAYSIQENRMVPRDTMFPRRYLERWFPPPYKLVDRFWELIGIYTTHEISPVIFERSRQIQTVEERYADRSSGTRGHKLFETRAFQQCTKSQ